MLNCLGMACNDLLQKCGFLGICVLEIQLGIKRSNNTTSGASYPKSDVHTMFDAIAMVYQLQWQSYLVYIIKQQISPMLFSNHVLCTQQ